MVKLDYKGKLSSDADTLTITEITGQYSSLKPLAWGSPNPSVSDASSAIVKLSKRNTDGSYGTETTVDVYSTLPSDSGGSVDISSIDAGFADSYADGIYKVIYQVAGTFGIPATPFNVSTTKYFALTPSIDCCYQKAVAKLSECSCNCEDEKIVELSFWMRALEGAECNGNLDEIQKIIDFMQSLCKKCGC